jgi:hypothetical protein
MLKNTALETLFSQTFRSGRHETRYEAHHEVRYEACYDRLYAALCRIYASRYVVHRGCLGDAREMPGGCPCRGDLKNHALAQSLLSRFFSWDVVDVGFPTCLTVYFC